MLESVGDETRQCDALHDLVVIHLHALHARKTLDLRQQDVRVQVIVGENELLELREFLELVQVLMVHNEVEPDVDEVHLFDRLIELRALEHLKGVAVNIQDLVGLNLRVTTLDKRA